MNRDEILPYGAACTALVGCPSTYKTNKTEQTQLSA